MEIYLEIVLVLENGMTIGKLNLSKKSNIGYTCKNFNIFKNKIRGQIKKETEKITKNLKKITTSPKLKQKAINPVLSKKN